MLVHCVVNLLTSSHPQMSASHLLALQVLKNGPRLSIADFVQCTFWQANCLNFLTLKSYETKLYLQHHVGLLICRILLEGLWLESSRDKNSKVRHHTVQDKQDFAYFICLRNRILSWFQLSSFDICTNCKSLNLKFMGVFLHIQLL